MRTSSVLDVSVAAALALAVILTRIPFAGTILYHWDSINFARALDHFDVRQSQPHLPGYIAYVALARAVRALTGGDAQSVLVGISMVGSGLAVAALYLLGTTMFDRRVGLVAALLLASSPLYWFYGEIALPHTLDAFMVLVGVWLLYRVRHGAHHLAVPAAIWLGVAGGIRPQTEVFLLPLATYAGWRVGWRRAAAALGALAVVDLAWFVPLATSAGGLAEYQATSRAFYGRFSASTSITTAGLAGLRYNLFKLGMYSVYAWAGGLLPVALLGSGWRAWAWVRDPRTAFVALWVLPSLAVYSLVHMGQQGLVFVFLPALCLISGAAWARLSRWRTAVAAIAVVANTLIFVAAPTFPLRTDRVKLLTADTLRRHDTRYAPLFMAVRRHCAPQHCLLVSTEWRFPQHYLPDYQLLGYQIGGRWQADEGRPTRAQDTWIDVAAMGIGPAANGKVMVVIVDAALLDAYDGASRPLQFIELAAGHRLPFFELLPNERLHLGPQSFGVK